MQPIILAPPRAKWLTFLAVALCFVAAGVLIVATGGRDRLAGWSSIVFFGGCAIVFLRQLADARPRVTISDRGIEDRSLKVGVIEWADIRDVQLLWQRRHAFLGLELRDPAKYTDRLSPLMQRMVALNGKFGFPPLSVNLAGTTAVPEQVEALVLRELALRSREAAV